MYNGTDAKSMSFIDTIFDLKDSVILFHNIYPLLVFQKWKIEPCIVEVKSSPIVPLDIFYYMYLLKMIGKKA